MRRFQKTFSTGVEVQELSVEDHVFLTVTTEEGKKPKKKKRKARDAAAAQAELELAAMLLRQTGYTELDATGATLPAKPPPAAGPPPPDSEYADFDDELKRMKRWAAESGDALTPRQADELSAFTYELEWRLVSEFLEKHVDPKKQIDSLEELGELYRAFRERSGPLRPDEAVAAKPPGDAAPLLAVPRDDEWAAFERELDAFIAREDKPGPFPLWGLGAGPKVQSAAQAGLYKVATLLHSGMYDEEKLTSREHLVKRYERFRALQMLPAERQVFVHKDGREAWIELREELVCYFDGAHEQRLTRSTKEAAQKLAEDVRRDFTRQKFKPKK